MITREITSRLIKLFNQYPIVTVMGPRQSGKTTLCRSSFPGLAYVNLESPDVRELAQTDPKLFLSRLDKGAVIDEVQRVPDLLSWLQVLVDEKRCNSLFVLTGSEQFQISRSISQSLAGRTALLRLLPFSFSEYQLAGGNREIDNMLFKGFYPRIHDQLLDPNQALEDYIETYVERDVRQIGEIRNLSSFRRFIRLCAGRVGQLINLSSLGSDAGISHTTASEWLTILEASYITFRLPPWFSNIRKRLVKSSKLYFYDVGLACHLIGIRQPEQLAVHPLRGPLFENMILMEILKHNYNRGQRLELSFFRDSNGLECDLLYPTGNEMLGIEIKSATTIVSDWFTPMDKVAQLLPALTRRAIIHGGEDHQQRKMGDAVPYLELSNFMQQIDDA